MEIIIAIGFILAFIFFVLFFILEAIVIVFGGLLLVIILPFAALFDRIDAVKKTKKVRKIKEDPRDGPTIVRVANNDLRNRPVNRPIAWRRKR